MITKERIEKAKDKLLREAKQIRNHIAALKQFSESNFLDKNNGKKVNARFFVPMARAMDCKEIEYQGKPWFPDAKFKFGFAPAPLIGSGRDVPQLQVHVCEGWCKFEIPLICDCSGRHLLDAEKTREAWTKIMGLRKKWADDRVLAASKVSMAAKAYNKIEAAAVKLAEKDLGMGPTGLEITVLCAFGGDIYDRIRKSAVAA